MNEAEKKIVDQIVKIYERASIPTINVLKIKQKVEKIQKLKRERMKELQVDSRRDKPTVQGKWKQTAKNGKKKQKFGDLKDNLFDVSSSVPDLEMEFYVDQQNERKMFIDSVDKHETGKIVNKIKRKEEEDKRIENEVKRLQMEKDSEKEKKKLKRQIF